MQARDGIINFMPSKRRFSRQACKIQFRIYNFAHRALGEGAHDDTRRKRASQKLCARIAEEKDLTVFHRLMQQLNEVLGRKKQRLSETEKPSEK
jgi:hypothetical protein